jgi:anti-sigma regulatory factor (Ser/Thr protein kinase)
LTILGLKLTMTQVMVDKRRRTHPDVIREFILAQADLHAGDLARAVSTRFGLSREASNRHIRRLVGEGMLTSTGATRGRRYELTDYLDEVFVLRVETAMDEELHWRQSVSPLLADLPENVVGICRFGFTEMFNNVVDHSESQDIVFTIRRNARRVALTIIDHGVGIFEKIRRHFDLEDARHAIFELSKGKLTSDPSSHTGEGIFFTSRIFDQYSIRSGSLYFERTNGEKDQDWLLDRTSVIAGTMIVMEISNSSGRTSAEVFERFAASDEDWGFKKTIVPVDLARYEGETLVSRSQAKRLLARFDRFVEVVLDFGGVADIGPAFADEIFRVYAREHPQVHMVPINTTANVQRLIRRALDAGKEPYQAPLP